MEMCMHCSVRSVFVCILMIAVSIGYQVQLHGFNMRVCWSFTGLQSICVHSQHTLLNSVCAIFLRSTTANTISWVCNLSSLVCLKRFAIYLGWFAGERRFVIFLRSFAANVVLRSFFTCSRQTVHDLSAFVRWRTPFCRFSTFLRSFLAGARGFALFTQLSGQNLAKFVLLCANTQNF